MIANLKTTALATAIALMVGYFAGYYTKGQFVKADQLDAATDAQHQTAVDIQESLKTSLAVDADVAASNQKVETVRKAVAARIKQKEIKNEANLHGECLSLNDICPGCRFSLDVGTVRLLNSARAGTAPDTTGLGDGESETPSEIGEAEFIDNDLQVVQMYHELATKHNALVDWVETQVKKQAK